MSRWTVGFDATITVSVEANTADQVSIGTEK